MMIRSVVLRMSITSSIQTGQIPMTMTTNQLVTMKTQQGIRRKGNEKVPASGQNTTNIGKI